MKPAKEYSILPQCERDGGYIIRPENDPVKKKSCVLISFVILAVLIIISGAFALVVGLFYSQEFTSTVNTYWNKGHANQSSSNTTSTGGSKLQRPGGGLDSPKNQILQNDTVTIPNVTTQQPQNVTKENSNFGDSGTGTGDGKTAPKKDEDVSEDDESLPPTTQKPATPSDTGADEDEEEDERENENDEETDDDVEADHHSLTTTTTTVPPAITEHPTKKTKPKHNKHNSTNQAADRQEEFAKTMQEMEKTFESVTGIRRAEFAIPLLMLLVFVVALALSSCCCYLILKRKDKQRRKDLGKMITDLQAGDKSILLDQDMDE